MARTTPVHAGYTIINGAGTGTNGNRIDVWVEYKLGSASVTDYSTHITAYFYAALNPSYSSTTSYSSGLNSTFTLAGISGTTVSGGAYDFTSSAKVNLLGSFRGSIPHEADGTKSLAIRGSFTTVSSYISGGSVSADIKLPAIAKNAFITAAPDTVLGQSCAVKWTPASAAHTYTLAFSLGSWKKTAANIAPARTTAYTYKVNLPMEAARQFTGRSAKMTVTLTTYQGSTALGSHTASLTVTVPDSDATRPKVTATVSPADTPFQGVYVQYYSKVAADITAQDPLGAEITGYGITVEGKTTNADLSHTLTTAGTVTVSVSATNSRGLTGRQEMTIQVLPYALPQVHNVSAYRCNAQGEKNEGGTYLYLSATPVFSDVQGLNSAALRWRIKEAGGAYGQWQTLTDAVVMDGLLYVHSAYTVQVGVIDAVGGTAAVSVSIPMEQVYMHRPAGGTGLGLGGYVTESDMLDVYWKLNARKGITASSINYRGNCADVDAAYLPGIYRLVSQTANTPYGDGILLVYNCLEPPHKNAPVFQMAVRFNGQIKARMCWNGTYYDWKALTDA